MTGRKGEPELTIPVELPAEIPREPPHLQRPPNAVTRFIRARMPPQGRLPLALASEILSRPCGSRWTLARALSPQTTPSAIALSRRSLSSTPTHLAAPRPTGHTRLPIPKTRLPPSYLPPPSRVHVVPFEHDEVNRQLAFQSAYLDPEFGLSSFFHAARNAYRNRLGKTVIKRVELVRLDPTYVPFWVTKANISLTLDKPPPSTSPEDDIINLETSKLLFPGECILGSGVGDCCRREGARSRFSRFSGPNAIADHHLLPP